MEVESTGGCWACIRVETAADGGACCRGESGSTGGSGGGGGGGGGTGALELDDGDDTLPFELFGGKDGKGAPPFAFAGGGIGVGSPPLEFSGADAGALPGGDAGGVVLDFFAFGGA